MSTWIYINHLWPISSPTVLSHFFIYWKRNSCAYCFQLEVARKKEPHNSQFIDREAMAGLQRSAVSFRRQGSSGFVWDDRFLSEELNKVKEDQNNNNDGGPEIKELHQVQTTPPPERTRSNGGARGYRTGKVSPAIEPPSPRLSACGFCAAFGKAGDNKPQRTTPAKHRPR